MPRIEVIQGFEELVTFATVNNEIDLANQALQVNNQNPIPLVNACLNGARVLLQSANQQVKNKAQEYINNVENANNAYTRKVLDDLRNIDW